MPPEASINCCIATRGWGKDAKGAKIPGYGFGILAFDSNYCTKTNDRYLGISGQLNMTRAHSLGSFS